MYQQQQKNLSINAGTLFFQFPSFSPMILALLHNPTLKFIPPFGINSDYEGSYAEKSLVSSPDTNFTYIC